MKEKTKYEEYKEKNYKKLVRNEFLYYNKSSGKYDFPIIRRQDVDISKIQFISYADTKLNDKENSNKSVHFFTYDWKFNKVYSDAENELPKLSQYYCLLSPDFSLFTDMPLALQIESVFKNRWCGAFWQSKGLNVIPTVAWGNEKSFDFCFDGIEEGSIVAVCTYYRENSEHTFMKGYNIMLEKIKPRTVICYDNPFPDMKGNIVSFVPTTYEWTKNLSAKDRLQFQWEKENRNVLGLDPKQFKFIDYEDPRAKTGVKRCDVCGNIVAIDQFGDGECKNCGWEQDKFVVDHPDVVMYTHLISLNKAKKLYSQGKAFLPDFNDFIEALYMYSEMLFKHDGTLYEVFIRGDDTIVFCSDEMEQEFTSKNDFINESHIGSRLLKDIWNEVTDVSYMY